MSQLETINIPGTRLQPTRVALGTWAIGGSMWGGSDDADSIRTIQSAIDRGINIIDTAPVYGFGHSEEIVGRALAEGGRRQKTIIATKVALDWKDGKAFRNASKARIEKEIEDSLRRLQTDVIDIYQVHWPDDATPIAETAETLGKLFKAGKIRAIGVSNFNVAQMEAFRAVAPLHTIQPPHNLFERGAEKDVLPYAAKNDIASLAYGPLCRGLLAGKMNANTTFTGDDLRRNDPKFQPPRFAQYLAAVSALEAFARNNYGKSVLDLAIRWVLDRQPLSIALWGARKPDQLDPISRVSDWKLDAGALTAIDKILADNIRDPVGPEFMAPPVRKAACSLDLPGRPAQKAAMNVTLIDNYDSFTFNLVHYLGELGAEVDVHRNDKVSVAEVIAARPDAIVISPGPCTPHEAGICLDLIREASADIPIFGVCLGHQAIGEVFGGDVVRAPIPVHGKMSEISHRAETIFRGINGPFRATRYHSLVVKRDTFPEELKVTAEADGLVMALSHKSRPVHGVQFHPESIESEHGHRILANFLELAQEWNKAHRGA